MISPRFFKRIAFCRSVFRFGAAAAILGAMTGCGNDPDVRAKLALLQEELARERAEARDMEERVTRLREQVERIEAENAAFMELNAGFNGTFGYPDGQPELSGTFRNDLDEPLSGLRVEVAFRQGRRTLHRELLEVAFDPMALAGDERSFTAGASPRIWGFRQIEQGIYEFTVHEATHPTGRVLRNDMEKLNSERSRLTRLENEFRKKRMRIGELVTTIGELEEGIR